MRSLVISAAPTGVSAIAISSELVNATAASFVVMAFPLLGGTRSTARADQVSDQFID
jgi:hypothetical protein